MLTVFIIFFRNGILRNNSFIYLQEEWAEEVKRALVPRLLKSFFLGDIRSLKSVCGEAVYNKLSADIRARKADGLVFDANLLSVEQNQLILKLVEETGPVIVCVYMVQQINCIRNRKGEIVEVSVVILNDCCPVCVCCCSCALCISARYHIYSHRM